MDKHLRSLVFVLLVALIAETLLLWRTEQKLVIEQQHSWLLRQDPFR